jgi:hypothetical protein
MHFCYDVLRRFRPDERFESGIVMAEVLLNRLSADRQACSCGALRIAITSCVTVITMDHDKSRHLCATTLAKREDIHLDRSYRLGFAVNHTPHLLGRLAAKDGFTTMSADSGRNVFDSNGFPIDVKDLANNHRAPFSLAADVTPKHNYLRRV